MTKSTTKQTKHVHWSDEKNASRKISKKYFIPFRPKNRKTILSNGKTRYWNRLTKDWGALAYVLPLNDDAKDETVEEMSIKKLQFQKVVRDVTHAMNPNLRFYEKAIYALQIAAESFLVDCMNRANQNCEEMLSGKQFNKEVKRFLRPKPRKLLF